MKDRVFLTVIGRDQIGVIAAVSATLLAWQISIRDITQKIIQDNFVLFMILDTPAGVSIQTLQAQLEDSLSRFQVKIMLAHENLFNSMHRI